MRLHNRIENDSLLQRTKYTQTISCRESIGPDAYWPLHASLTVSYILRRET